MQQRALFQNELEPSYSTPHPVITDDPRARCHCATWEALEAHGRQALAHSPTFIQPDWRTLVQLRKAAQALRGVEARRHDEQPRAETPIAMSRACLHIQ